MTDNVKHVHGSNCPVCTPSGLTIADLPIGSTVRIPHRADTVAVIDEHYPTSGLVGVKITTVDRNGRKRYGYALNYPHQCFLMANDETP